MPFNIIIIWFILALVCDLDRWPSVYRNVVMINELKSIAFDVFWTFLFLCLSFIFVLSVHSKRPHIIRDSVYLNLWCYATKSNQFDTECNCSHWPTFKMQNPTKNVKKFRTLNRLASSSPFVYSAFRSHSCVGPQNSDTAPRPICRSDKPQFM